MLHVYEADKEGLCKANWEEFPLIDISNARKELKQVVNGILSHLNGINIL